MMPEDALSSNVPDLSAEERNNRDYDLGSAMMSSEPIPVPVAPVAAIPSSMETALTEMRSELTQLRQLFEDKLLRDGSHQLLVKSLHESLTAAQGDLVARVLRPMLLQLVQIYDAVVAAQRAEPKSKRLPELAQDIEDILYRQGYERYSCPGDKLDPKLQTVRRTRPASDPADVGRIVERLRPGFRSENQVVLRPEEVVVFASTAAEKGTKQS